MPNQIYNAIQKAKIVSDEVKDTFANLSSEQLNWKPNSESWSIAQCLEHLVITNSAYLVNIKKVAEGNHKNNIYSMIPVFGGFIGKFLKKAVNPDYKKKVKTFASFTPVQSNISETVIEDFQSNQDELVSLMESVKDLDGGKIKIVTPISKLLNIRLNDACEVLVMHEQRHFNQAKRVMEMEGFPG